LVDLTVNSRKAEVLATMLLNQPYSAFFYFGGKFVLFVDSSIPSKIGASSKPGAIHDSKGQTLNRDAYED